ncbi:hypothetical protein L9F63_010253, partial [Diploptera punctata]
MATCYSSFDLGPPRHCTPAPHKDYSRPLHVDCSVEYELPNQAKPPEGARSEPLLMIHPCYYRRAESQRRSPFINNLPTPRGVVTASRRSQASQVRIVPHQQQQQQQQQPPQQQQPQPPPPQQPQQQQHYQIRYLEATNQQPNWNQQQLEPPPVYSKPVGAKPGKRDPLLCGGGDFSSGSDSGVSAGHWTDSDRSPLAPEVRLHRDFHNNNNNHHQHAGGGGGGTDSGIATPVSLADDKTVLSEG